MENPFRSEAERLGDFEDLHIGQPEAARRAQASRCMNCGVPFCQSDFGCPLHNLIPEWNDLLYRGLEREALDRLLQTAPFPEFTGHVCPALCEKACNLAEDAVTNRDNELYRNSPVRVFFERSGEEDPTFAFKVKPLENNQVQVERPGFSDKPVTVPFGDTLRFKDLSVVFKPGTSYGNYLMGEDILIRKIPVRAAAGQFLGGLRITESKGSILNLFLLDASID